MNRLAAISILALGAVTTAWAQAPSRAGRAADLLASKGFKVAGAVGAQNYETQGGKLTKIEPKKAAPNATAKSER